MTHYAYLFEAKGLQSFLGDSGRLIDLIGGSDLIAAIAQSSGDDLLSDVLACSGIGEVVAPSRRAGGAFCLHSQDRESLIRLRAAWRLRLAASVPGLAFADVLTDGHDDRTDALRAAYKTQSGLRENSTAMLLPLAPPGCVFNPRTARPAVAIDHQGGKEPVDAVTKHLRDAGRDVSQGDAATDRVSRRFLGDAETKRFVFPRQFDLEDADRRNPAFPFLTEPRRIGVVHADISGLGQLFMHLVDAAADLSSVLAVAMGIETAIEAAARKAMAEVVLPEAIPREGHEDLKLHARLFGADPEQGAPEGARGVLPARPVLLGGDDLTVILRADLAVPFAEVFLTALEWQSREKLNALREAGHPVKAESLTACAGVALVSKGHPYVMAAHLAESMCDSAKTVVKARQDAEGAASAITFASVESAIGDDYETFRDRELIASRTGALLTGTPYTVGEQQCEGVPRLADLTVLAGALGTVRGRGKFFEAAEETTGDPTRSYKRFWEVFSIDDPSKCKDLRTVLETISGHRHRLDGGDENAWEDARRHELRYLLDALEIVDAGALRTLSSWGAPAEEEGVA